MKDYEKKASAIAAAITMAVVALTLAVLFTCSLTWDRDALASSPKPEIQEEEELFISPELIDLGEMSTPDVDEATPSEAGEPVKADEEVKKPVERGENPEPAPPVENKITQAKESPVKAKEPTATKEERRRVSSKLAGKFSSKNGAADGKFNSENGAGAAGVGVNGNARGRTFLGCPKPVVELTNKTVVVVDITVDEDGNVTSASARGSASATIRRKCEQSARQARWSKKRGAGDTRGTITFTITPR